MPDVGRGAPRYGCDLPDRSRGEIWRHTALLCVLGLALWAAPCGMWDLYGNDEGRYVQVGKELVSGSHWLLLTLHGEPYDEKPPLAFWLFGGMIWLQSGVSSWGVRLPAAIAATVAVVLTYLIGRHRFSARAGMASAGVLMTTPVFYQHAMTARLDMIYASWSLLALFAFLTRDEGRKMPLWRAGAFWLGLGGAFFTKGPLALAFTFALIADQARAARSWEPLASLRPVPGAVALGGSILLWLWAQSTLVSPEFVTTQVVQQTLERLVGGVHVRPPWFYVTHMFRGLFMPWTLWLIPAVLGLRGVSREARGSLRPILFYAGFALIFCSAIPGKRQTYLLPALPTLALVVGWYLDSVLLAREDRLQWARFGCVVAWLISLCIAALGAYLWLSPASLPVWADRVRSVRAIGDGFDIAPLQVAACVIAAVAGAAVAAMVWRWGEHGHVVLHGLIALLLVYYTAVFIPSQIVRGPLRSTRAFSDEAESLLVASGEAGTIGAAGRARAPEYHVYGGYAVQHLGDSLTRVTPEMLPALIAMEEPIGRERPCLVRGADYEVAYRGRYGADGILLCTRRAPHSDVDRRASGERGPNDIGSGLACRDSSTPSGPTRGS